MAKAKKPESGKSGKSNPAAPAPAPIIDAALAAESAARMLMARKQSASPTAPQPDSAAFKKMKQSLNKPHLQGIDAALGGPARPTNRPGGRGFGGAQVGHNQTFGADVNRSGVPRRTGG